MGWSTWEAYYKDISRDKIVANMQVLNRTGLQKLGYNMIAIDDGWARLNATTRWLSRENAVHVPNGAKRIRLIKHWFGYAAPKNAGCMIADPVKFPNGLSAMFDEIHANDFLVSIYTAGNNFACPMTKKFVYHYMSGKFFDVDVQCFNNMDIDMLKVDNCAPILHNGGALQKIMKWRTAIREDILLHNSRYACLAQAKCLSVYNCPMGVVPQLNNVIPSMCYDSADMVRTAGDMKAKWYSIVAGALSGAGRGLVNRPGLWSDLDFIIPDEKKLSLEHIKAYFAMWCVMSSPLILSFDLTTVSDVVINVFKNPHAIRIDQVYNGDAGDLVSQQGAIWFFRKSLGNGEWAVSVVNVGKKVFARAKTIEYWNVAGMREFMLDKLEPVSCEFANVWDAAGKTKLEPLTTFRVVPRQLFAIREETGVFFLVSNCTT